MIFDGEFLKDVFFLLNKQFKASYDQILTGITIRSEWSQTVSAFQFQFVAYHQKAKRKINTDDIRIVQCTEYLQRKADDGATARYGK